MLVCGNITNSYSYEGLNCEGECFKMFYLIIVKHTDKTNGMI